MLTVHRVVHPFVERVDLRSQVLGIQVNGGFVSWEEFVECRVEDSDDLRALVVHDRVCLLVPQQGYRIPVYDRFSIK